MKRVLALSVCLVLVSMLVIGCGSGVSEDKPIAEIQKEAQTMSLDQLKGIVTKYQKAIEAKKPELMKLQAKLREVPITQLMSKDAVALKEEISSMANSIKALTDRMRAYQAALNKKM